MTPPPTSSADQSRALSIAVSGATGLVGGALSKALQSLGHTARMIVRRPLNSDESAVYWNQDANTLDAGAMQGLDAVVHLAGEPIVGRWTPAKRQRILNSRIKSTQLIANTIAGLSRKPSVFVSASAIGYYGHRGDTILDETAAPGNAGEGFLREVCEQWEAATKPASDAGIRVVRPRIGMVLAPDDGALSLMTRAFRLGLGGRIGSGRQWTAWIHIDDLVNILITAITDDALHGPVNAVSPTPVTNLEFTKALGEVLRRPTMLPAPAFALRLMLGDMADEILLPSQRVVPAVLQSQGFEWRYNELEAALRHLLAPPEVIP